jgi:nucleoside-diphosphate-sugar epimerase
VRRPAALEDGLVIDLCDRRAIANMLGQVRPDVVIHAAGRSAGSAAELFADNARATANLAVALGSASPAAGLVLIGSAAQYGAGEPGHRWAEDEPGLPLDLYGLSKLAAESCAFAAAGHAGLQVASLRLFNVVDASPRGEQMFAHLLRKARAAARAGPPPWRVPMGALDAVRDFVSLDDVLTAVERMVDRGVWGEAINVCTGVGRPARELTQAVAAALGGRLGVEEAPPDRAAGIAWSVGDPSKGEARLGLRPSADLSQIIRAAAEAIAGESEHARSRA